LEHSEKFEFSVKRYYPLTFNPLLEEKILKLVIGLVCQIHANLFYQIIFVSEEKEEKESE
jgi:hypothetical protein